MSGAAPASRRTAASRPRRRWIGALVVAVCTLGAAAAEVDPARAGTMRTAFDQDIRPLLERYCVDCHGAARAKAGVDFAYFDSGSAALNHLEIWQRACQKVASRSMPPEGEAQPDETERQRLLTWLKDVRSLAPPDPGPLPFRRLSRREYGNTVRDLFGADVDGAAGLAEDSAGAAFDNSVSPLLMEQYLLAADAVLDRLILPAQLHRRFAAGQLPAIRAGAAEPGAPEATSRRFAEPGEVWTMIDVPVDGAYAIRIAAGADAGAGDPARLGVRIGDRVVAELRITARADHPAAVTSRCDLAAGRTRFAVVFMNPVVATPPPVDAGAGAAAGKPGAVAKKPAARPGAAKPTRPDAAPTTRAVVIDAIEITGPPVKPPTEAQKRLFTAMPGDALAKRDAARAILAPFLARAWRRPPHPDEVEGVLTVFDLADAQDQDFIDAVKLALKAVLVSPQFLFRSSDVAADEPPGAILPVDGYELAARLSYFLWATMPDEPLLALARDGGLRDPATLEAQVRRLIADRRSRALVESFAAPWLGLDRLAATNVDVGKYPQMTPALRQAMYEEAMVAIESLMRDGGSILDLIDCDYAWVNGLTAKLYGLDEVKGGAMRKVTLPDHERGGLVTMPAILTVTSRPDRTSPVKRGKWVLETILDAAPPPPPPDVPSLDKQDAADGGHLTLRQRTERHRTDQVCASCHRVMDPLGFGLENFDAIGRWRRRDDTGGAVDASGELPDGGRFTSPSGLKRLLMGRKDEFVRSFTARLLAFALGRRLAAYDEVVVDRLAERAAQRGYRLDALIVDIAGSYPFLNRRSVH